MPPQSKLSQLILSSASFAARLLPMPVKRSIYRFPGLAKFVRRGLNQAAPQGLTAVKVAGGGLAGMELNLDLQSEKDYWLGTYEPELQAAIEELVKPGMTAYDVGANIGYISLLLARRVGEAGQVFAFEAFPGNVERLAFNLSSNGLQRRVYIFAGAVVESTRPVQFLIGPSGGMGKALGSAGRKGVGYSSQVTVPGICLDEFVYLQGHQPPDVVKMDIEGGEVLALPGMSRILQEVHPLLFLELHGPESAKVAWETLIPAGYQLCQMRAGYPGISSLETLAWKAYVVAVALGTMKG